MLPRLLINKYTKALCVLILKTQIHLIIWFRVLNLRPLFSWEVWKPFLTAFSRKKRMFIPFIGLGTPSLSLEAPIFETEWLSLLPSIHVVIIMMYLWIFWAALSQVERLLLLASPALIGFIVSKNYLEAAYSLAGNNVESYIAQKSLVDNISVSLLSNTVSFDYFSMFTQNFIYILMAWFGIVAISAYSFDSVKIVKTENSVVKYSTNDSLLILLAVSSIAFMVAALSASDLWLIYFAL